MSLQTRLEALAQAVGADVKALRAQDWTEQILAALYNNSTVTGSDVNSGFAPAANSRYLVEAKLSVQTASPTTAIQVALAGPTTGITAAAVKMVAASSATVDAVGHYGLNAFPVFVNGMTTPTILTIDAIIETGATVGAGNVRVQARSEVAGSAVSVRPGSLIRWRKL